MTRLYAVQRLDDRVIADRYGVPTWRVTRRRRELNIVRQRVSRAGAAAAPSRPGPEVLHRLFVTQALPIWVIAEQFGTSPRLVRSWLTEAVTDYGRGVTGVRTRRRRWVRWCPPCTPTRR